MLEIQFKIIVLVLNQWCQDESVHQDDYLETVVRLGKYIISICKSTGPTSNNHHWL